ncbi:hypothetical protein DP939_16070 [Spongiactinospora rosea]|uniref:NACHT domain-containing protein n=1 Tax=Spongiactinospora rosea TaxID=2248750 RepID=A0A366M1C2_9ACTN|nr:hypothetical protein DP939_16070 [Spongiactinospora rosea]
MRRRWLVLMAGAAIVVGVAAAVVGLASEFAVDDTAEWLPSMRRYPLPWLAGAVAIGVVAALLLWWAQHAYESTKVVPRDGGAPEDPLDAVLREIAVEQRRRVGERRERGRVYRSEPLPVMWSDDSSPAARRPVGTLVDRFVGRLLDPGDGVPRVVITGSPGAGKTTLAAMLVEGVLAAPRVTRVPVVFRLASWEPDRVEPAKWMRSRLAEDFPDLGRRYGKGVYHKLIGDRRIIAVFDGLDEIRDGLRPVALVKIDEWLRLHQDATPFVLTCRAAEYARLEPTGHVLPKVPVYQLQPVDSGAAMAYLGSGPAWEPVRRRLAEEGEEGPLAQALSTPLMIGLAHRVFGGHEPSAGPERLADRAALPDRESIEAMLLGTFAPEVLRDDHRFGIDNHGKKGRWPVRGSLRWLRFLARRLAALDEHDIGWSRLHQLAPNRWPLVPALCGLAAGAVVAHGARLVGLPTGLRWGVAAGAGCAVLLWLLDKGAAGERPRHPVGGALFAGTRIGMYGGLAVGLPGAFFAGLAGETLGTLLLGAALAIVAGLLAPEPRRTATMGAAMLSGTIAGAVAWLVAALVCGFPQGAQVSYATRLPGGAAAGALQAWRAALGYGLADQLRFAGAFSLTVGIVVGVLMAGTGMAARLIEPRYPRRGRHAVAAATLFAVAGGVVGAGSAVVLAGPAAGASAALIGTAFGALFGPLALRRRRPGTSVRAEELQRSMGLRVKAGMIGGLLGGGLGGFLLPGQYAYLETDALGNASAGAADGMQAGLALGLISGIVFAGSDRNAEGVGVSPEGRRRLLMPLSWAGLGLAVGALMGVALNAALARFIMLDGTVVVVTYALTGLTLGAAGAVAVWVEGRPEMDPESTLRTARTTTLGAGVLVGVAGGAVTGMVTNPTYGVIAIVMVLTLVVGTSPWGLFTVSRCRLALGGRIPWRFTRFLRDMYDLEILRRAGAGYQLRHVRLRDELAGANRRESAQVPVAHAGARAVTAPGRSRRVAAACAAVVVLAGVGVTGPLRPAVDPAPSQELRAALDDARWVDKPLSPSIAYSGFPYGYAFRATLKIHGPGLAGVNLPGLAYVLISCQGQYAFFLTSDPAGPTQAKRQRVALTGYTTAIDTGSPCTNTITVLARRGTLRLFVETTYCDEVRLPTLGPVPDPKPMSLSSQRGDTYVMVLSHGMSALGRP